MEAASCETCGNIYEKAFRILSPDGGQRVFDSFECAIQALAPTCAHCRCRVIGHGVEDGTRIFCCAHCAKASGVQGARDHV